LVAKVDCKRFDFHDARRSSCGHDQWLQRKWDRLEIDSAEVPGFIPKNGPTSFVAAEIHLGRRPAGICDR
ncbi:MAG TPA: hypothetical protein VE267_05740, partial [Bradyrhizobium sp.]|nr:hypothetical protein [Bradyrhizobium sp.]